MLQAMKMGKPEGKNRGSQQKWLIKHLPSMATSSQDTMGYFCWILLLPPDLAQCLLPTAPLVQLRNHFRELETLQNRFLAPWNITIVGVGSWPILPSEHLAKAIMPSTRCTSVRAWMGRNY